MSGMRPGTPVSNLESVESQRDAYARHARRYLVKGMRIPFTGRVLPHPLSSKAYLETPHILFLKRLCSQSQPRARPTSLLPLPTLTVHSLLTRCPPRPFQGGKHGTINTLCALIERASLRQNQRISVEGVIGDERGGTEEVRGASGGAGEARGREGCGGGIPEQSKLSHQDR
jgi:hypothetical protein